MVLFCENMQIRRHRQTPFFATHSDVEIQRRPIALLIELELLLQEAVEPPPLSLDALSAREHVQLLACSCACRTSMIGRTLALIINRLAHESFSGHRDGPRARLSGSTRGDARLGATTTLWRSGDC